MSKLPEKCEHATLVVAGACAQCWHDRYWAREAEIEKMNELAAWQLAYEALKATAKHVELKTRAVAALGRAKHLLVDIEATRKVPREDVLEHSIDDLHSALAFLRDG